jgi:hypothetical protein
VNRFILGSLLTVAALATHARAAFVGFNYTQSDSGSGMGTVSAFTLSDPGGDINFTPTPLTATLFNPNTALTPAGYVGAITSMAGSTNEGNVAVGLLMSGTVTATGTRGGQQYTIQIPLRFVPKQTQSPDVSDYTWDVAFGDNPGAGVDASSTSMRFAMWLGRDDVINGAETPETFQRYTQVNHTFGAGVQDAFANNHTTTAAIKDATDPANDPPGVDAAGRDIAFYFGWRDQGALNSGAVLIDTFTIGGLVEANESTLTLVPEPSSAFLLLGGAGLLLRRRRAR